MLKCPICGNDFSEDSSKCTKVLVSRDDKRSKITSTQIEYAEIFCKTIGMEFSVYPSVDFVTTINNKLAQIEVQKRYNVICEFLLKNRQKKNSESIKSNYFFWYSLPSESTSNLTTIDVNDLMKNYPKNLTEKMDRILLNLARHCPNIGQKFFDEYLPSTMFFLEWIDKIEYEKETLLDYLVDLEYLTCIHNDNLPKYLQTKHYKLTSKAWERIDELQKNDLNSSNAFVAMSFHESTKPTREAIRKGIENTKFSASFMDEIIHSRQIVPEMLRLIKESRFLIMDISNPNYGAYFEAGYALGLGKEVIITCKKDVFETKTYKDWIEEKAFKPHFDIAQRQILVWDNETDLTTKLEQWIKFLFV